MKYAARHSFLLLSICLSIVGPAGAQVRLPHLISDGMVLQRDTKIKIWGWASPGEKLRIDFDRKHYRAVTGAGGKWMLVMGPLKAGGPYMMSINGRGASGSNANASEANGSNANASHANGSDAKAGDQNAGDEIIIRDILVGDVWFCSGQSNMVVNMERVKEKYPDVIAAANFPQIRNFFISTVSDVSKLHDDLPPGSWQAADPKQVLNFGAASFFFARALYSRYHVPIGVINSSVGGTPVQAWISEQGLKDIASYSARLARLKDTAFPDRLMHPVRTAGRADGQRADAGNADGKNAATRTPRQMDKGMSGPVTWYDTKYVATGWHPFWLPGYWADQGIRGLNGVVWFRKEIDVPATMVGKVAHLYMGRIVDADIDYVNGVQVGAITYQYPPRRYVLPAGLLKAGKNSIVVRVVNNFGKGGFVPDKPYFLEAGGEKIDLRGDWKYKVGEVFDPARGFGAGGGGGGGGGGGFPHRTSPPVYIIPWWRR